MSATAAGFISYAHVDDQHDHRYLTRLRERLEGEVRAQTGTPFRIFQDRNDIAWGQQWRERIEGAIDGSTFLIPIVTPSFLASPECRQEFERFLRREKQLGRNDLILPIYYIACIQLEEPSKWPDDPIVQELAARQYTDWRSLRGKNLNGQRVQEALTKLAIDVRDALVRTTPTVESAILNAPSPLISPHVGVQGVDLGHSPVQNAQDLDRRIQAQLLLKNARTAMEDSDTRQAKADTEEAIRLCPDLESHAREQLGLWMAALLVDDFLSNPLQFARAPRWVHGEYFLPEQLPTAEDAIEQLSISVNLGDSDAQLLLALAQLYGMQGEYQHMIDGIRTIINRYPDVAERLHSATYLAPFAYACSKQANPEDTLRLLGTALNLSLPASLALVRQSVANIQTDGPNTYHTPNVDWFVMARGEYWSGLSDTAFVTMITIQREETTPHLKGHAMFLIPAPGPVQHIPSEAVEVLSGNFSHYIPLDDLLAELDERFLFVVQR